MKILHYVKKIFWNIYVKALFITVAVLAAFLITWDYWDFAHREGQADSKEDIGEKALWKFVADDIDNSNKFAPAHSLDSLGFNNKKGDLQSKKKEIAELKKWAADRMRRLRYQDQCLRERLPKELPSNNHLYLDDLCLLQELEVRFAHLAILFSEISVNSELYFQRDFDSKLCDEFYKVYDRERHTRRFAMPGKVVLNREMSNVGGAAALQTYRCGVQHGCFRLYQGTSQASLRHEFAELPQSLLTMCAKDAVYEANYACLFKRIHNGSKIAGVYRWLKNPRIILFNLSRSHEILALAINNHDFLADPANPYLRFVPFPEDETWKEAQYLALAIDNFLWTVKYSVDHCGTQSAILKYRIRPLYAKNSPAMQHYTTYFAIYPQYHYVLTRGTLDILGKERGELKIAEEYDTDMKKLL
ncbi:MAG: hypothetical protein Q4F00_01615 [bacterium]|nr:hypothetical protein [bacterium]